MNVVNLVYAVVSALIALGILIVIHELGHFLVAKKSGVGVLTFSIGFGPKIFKRKVGETEYAVSAFPFGGYVKMVGEDPEEAVSTVDVEKSFSHQSLAKRAAIVAAGPLSNLVLALVVFVSIFMAYGVPVSTTQVGTVAPDSPAAAASIQKGDRIVAINGQPIQEWEELSRRIKESQGTPLKVRVLRDNKEIEITVQPSRSEGKNIFGEKQEGWFIGVTSEAVLERGEPVRAIRYAFYKTGEYSVVTLLALFKMIAGDISPKNLGGPVLIAQMAGQQAREGLTNFLYFVAVLSINLGVLNLLPIPVLDGGHLLFFGLEWILGRPVGIKQRERAQQVGILILLMVMIYAFYNDIARFFEG
ncbi:MAG TPA: RIP metalloprotease RseP [Candidatus Binatia bacterium]|jgi:regulator of sigma E protease